VLARGADATTATAFRDRCPAAVTQFQVSELPGPGVGGEAGDPVPADTGEPQPGAGVGLFLADDHPHPLRPGRQVQRPVSSATQAPGRTRPPAS
jgi:hypothetical protein